MLLPLTTQPQVPSFPYQGHCQKDPLFGMRSWHASIPLPRGLEVNAGFTCANLLAVAGPSRLAGDFGILEGQRAPKLLHANPGGRSAGHHQATVRRQHPKGRQVRLDICRPPPLEAGISVSNVIRRGFAMKQCFKILFREIQCVTQSTASAFHNRANTCSPTPAPLPEGVGLSLPYCHISTPNPEGMKRMLHTAWGWQGWRFCRGNVEKVIDGKDQRGAKDMLLRDLDLVQVLDRDVENLSGGDVCQESVHCLSWRHLALRQAQCGIRFWSCCARVTVVRSRMVSKKAS